MEESNWEESNCQIDWADIALRGYKTISQAFVASTAGFTIAGLVAGVNIGQLQTTALTFGITAGSGLLSMAHNALMAYLECKAK